MNLAGLGERNALWSVESSTRVCALPQINNYCVYVNYNLMSNAFILLDVYTIIIAYVNNNIGPCMHFTGFEAVDRNLKFLRLNFLRNIRSYVA